MVKVFVPSGFEFLANSAPVCRAPPLRTRSTSAALGRPSKASDSCSNRGCCDKTAGARLAMFRAAEMSRVASGAKCDSVRRGRSWCSSCRGERQNSPSMNRSIWHCLIGLVWRGMSAPIDAAQIAGPASASLTRITECNAVEGGFPEIVSVHGR